MNSSSLEKDVKGEQMNSFLLHYLSPSFSASLLSLVFKFMSSPLPEEALKELAG